ncbi:uncharacterized protein LAESUDRAFT_510216 [Laetiporus sulphureus 93-53]|uniref:Uncharacterized protein n=1 Tax=Laetiporus sulphureus 93-53 TaxID=1314785 RepID=A0A165FXY6_9APHY|nr:uncharacterized protein LAESUDRAFT_510216 [Laetiporus sulphureus 93-53]KZT09563.1 hypothetical protein LAESUDRAFT_510216 [Laetiporus sulphureus 93-53]
MATKLCEPAVGGGIAREVSSAITATTTSSILAYVLPSQQNGRFLQSLVARGSRPSHSRSFYISKAPIPQVNLKDRIAALQQRNAGSNQTDNKHAVSTGRVGSLRDKIATFEKQGAVPVPRGSFGLGAPPADDGSSRRRGELVGNRVPGLSKPVVPVSVHPSQDVDTDSPSGRRRSASASAANILSSSASSPPAVSSTDDDSSSSDAPATTDETQTPGSPPAARTKRRSLSELPPNVCMPEAGQEASYEYKEAQAAPVIVVSPDAEAAAAKSVTVAKTKPSAKVVVSNVTLHREEASITSGPRARSTLRALEKSPGSSAPEPCVSMSPPRRQPKSQYVSVEDPNALDEELAFVRAALNALEAASEDTTPTRADVQDSSADGDYISITNRTSATSSVLSTPNDLVTFAGMEYVKLEHELVEGGTLSRDADGAIITSSSAGAATASQRRGTVTSLALDTNEAVIVTAPARVVSPISTTRAVLVPVPQSLSPISSPIPSSGPNAPHLTASAYTTPSLTPKTSTGSFKAIVDGKVSSSISQGQPRAGSSHIRQPQLKLTVESSSSSGYGDLADLLADAALLEQQLSGMGNLQEDLDVKAAPAAAPVPAIDSALAADYVPVPVPAPALALEPEPAPSSIPASIRDHDPEMELTLPDHPPPPYVEIVGRERPRPIQELPECVEEAESSQHEPPQELPSDDLPRHASPMASSTQEYSRNRIPSGSPPPVPPKSPRPRYFSTLLSRKTSNSGTLSTLGTAPRQSNCSEMSEDDSMLVPTPPSPRVEYIGSDASSIRSSTRSWKMPKSTLSRATSFADKLLNKKSRRNSIVISNPNNTHLSAAGVQSGSAHVKSPSSPEDRPVSWVPVEGRLDNALFDAFPSVPNSVLPSSPQPPSQYLSPSGHPGRSATIPPNSSHSKQRSAFL